MSHQTTLQNICHGGAIETGHRLVCLLQPIIGQHFSIPDTTVDTPAAMSPFIYHDIAPPYAMQYNQLHVARPGQNNAYC